MEQRRIVRSRSFAAQESRTDEKSDFLDGKSLIDAANT
jgi:hypothetical protein